MAIDQLSSDVKEGMSKEDIINELNKDDDEVKDEKVEDDDEQDSEDGKSSKEGKSEEGEEGGEEEEKEPKIKLIEENEEEKLDEDDEVKLVTPFKKAEIEKDFPGIFKKYPYLEKAYYTEKAYRDVFSSVEEAKEAVDRIETLKEIEESLAGGSTSDVISRVKDYDEKAFAKLVDNYLPSLHKVDPEAHNHVVGGVVKNLIAMFAREAKSTDNDELRKVALAINKFVFNTDKFEPHAPLVAKTAENDEVQQERQQYLQERFEETRDDLQGKVDDVLKNTIKGHIDPRSVLTDYVKKNAVRDAMEDVRAVIAKDSGFRKKLDSLWEVAFKSRFNRASTEAIRKAYLSKAQTILPDVIKKARNEALKGVGKRVKEEEEDGDSDTQKSERKYVKSDKRGSLPSNSKGHSGKKVDIPKGMSTLDFLNQGD